MQPALELNGDESSKPQIFDFLFDPFDEGNCKEIETSNLCPNKPCVNTLLEPQVILECLRGSE